MLSKTNSIISGPLDADTIFFEVEDWAIFCPRSTTAVTLRIKGVWTHRTLPREDRVKDEIQLYYDEQTVASNPRNLCEYASAGMIDSSKVGGVGHNVIVFARQQPEEMLRSLYPQ